MQDAVDDERWKEVKAVYAKWKEELAAKAERLVVEEFPRKVMELNKLLDGPLFDPKSMEPNDAPASAGTTALSVGDARPYPRGGGDGDGAADRRESGGTAVYHFVHGPVPCNAHIVAMSEASKPYLRQGVEDFDLVKMWILFLMPRMEDGNNFGVAIQEQIFSEVMYAEEDFVSFADELTDYLCARGELICCQARNPMLGDYSSSIYDMDENEFISIRNCMMDLRDNYSGLHDLIVKNIDKIKTPRVTSRDLVY